MSEIYANDRFFILLTSSGTLTIGVGRDRGGQDTRGGTGIFGFTSSSEVGREGAADRRAFLRFGDTGVLLACGLGERDTSLRARLESIKFERLNLPRRSSDSIRRIVATLPRMHHGRAARFKRSPLFPLAEQVLEMRQAADGASMEQVTRDEPGDKKRGRRGRAPRKRKS